MTVSPTGEIIILIVSLVVLGFFLLREAFGQNKTNWRLGLSDFLVRPVNEPNGKSIAVLILGLLFIGIIFYLIAQRISVLWE